MLGSAELGELRRRQDTAGYVEVNSPQLMDAQLWVTTGHMQAYGDLMFLTSAGVLAVPAASV